MRSKLSFGFETKFIFSKKLNCYKAISCESKFKKVVLESEWSLFRLWWGSRWLSTESLPIWTIYGRSVPRIMWFNRYSSSFHSFQKLCRELALAVLDWEHLPWFSHIFWNISIDNSIMPMNTIKSKQVLRIAKNESGSQSMSLNRVISLGNRFLWDSINIWPIRKYYQKSNSISYLSCIK